MWWRDESSVPSKTCSFRLQAEGEACGGETSPQSPPGPVASAFRRKGKHVVAAARGLLHTARHADALEIPVGVAMPCGRSVRPESPESRGPSAARAAGDPRAG